MHVRTESLLVHGFKRENVMQHWIYYKWSSSDSHSLNFAAACCCPRGGILTKVPHLDHSPFLFLSPFMHCSILIIQPSHTHISWSISPLYYQIYITQWLTWKLSSEHTVYPKHTMYQYSLFHLDVNSPNFDSQQCKKLLCYHGRVSINVTTPGMVLW